MTGTHDEGEQRALAVAQADFAKRVTWATGYHVTVTTERDHYRVSYLRQLEAGEAMIRGGGADMGVEYEVNRDFEIERITYPR